jgi:pimeloyl-ACP methyl ester carboxylesterase
LAIRHPERVRGLIIQNGDIDEDTLGPKYQLLRRHWEAPTPETRAQIQSAISKAGFEEEFLNEVRPELAARIAPDLWELHWSLMTPHRQRIALREVVPLARDFLDRVHAG